MALTKISTDGVKDDAVTAGKIPANAVGSSELADNAVDTNAIQDDAVTADKLANSINTTIAANTAKVQTTINNNADNRLITGSGTANTLNGESALTFDGSQFSTSPLIVGSGNISKTQDGVVIQRSSTSGSAEFVAGRSGGNYSQMQFYVAGASGVTKRHDIDYQSNFLWYDEDGSTEMMRLQHNNRLGIGTNNPTHKFQVADSNTAIGFSRNGQDAQIVFDSNTVTNCGIIEQAESSGGGEMKFFTKDTGGTSRERIRLLTSGGITFNGDSAAANALDDYEEGTFTAYLYGTVGNPTQSYQSQNGYYIKIGRFVNVTVDILMAASGISGGSGLAAVSIPFAQANLTNHQGVSASVGYAPSWGAITPTAAYASPNNTFLYLMGNDKDTGANFVQASQIGNSTRLIMGFSYATN